MNINNFSTNNKKKNNRHRKARHQLILFNSVISVLLAVCLLFTGALGLGAYVTSDMKKVDLSDDHSELGITSEAAKLPKTITNIALFGIDTRDKNTTDRNKALSGNSDTMIVLSINTNNNTIKLTSLLRDSWVPIDGWKYESYKLNAAYGGGGAQKAIQTINNNYGLNIKDYVSVSLHQMWKVIDLLGGIDITITEMERKKINYLANSEGFGIEPVEKSGFVHLNGGQAMSYSRIRDDSEEIRVKRQQKVLSALFEKAKGLSPSDYVPLLKAVLSNVETSLSFDEILSYAPLLALADLHIQSTSIPGAEVIARGGIFNDTRGGWVWKYDLDDAKKHIYKWIYGISEE